MSLKGRINKLEKDMPAPKPEIKYILSWGDAEETPVEKAEREAARPTHDENGELIKYIQIKWGDEPDIPGRDVDDDTRIKWAEDVINGAGSDEDAPNQGAMDE